MASGESKRKALPNIILSLYSVRGRGSRYTTVVTSGGTSGSYHTLSRGPESSERRCRSRLVGWATHQHNLYTHSLKDGQRYCTIQLIEEGLRQNRRVETDELAVVAPNRCACRC